MYLTLFPSLPDSSAPIRAICSAGVAHFGSKRDDTKYIALTAKHCIEETTKVLSAFSPDSKSLFGLYDPDSGKEYPVTGYTEFEDSDTVLLSFKPTPDMQSVQLKPIESGLKIDGGYADGMGGSNTWLLGFGGRYDPKDKEAWGPFLMAEMRRLVVRNIEAYGNEIRGNALTRGLNGHSGSCLMVSDPVTSEKSCIGTWKSSYWGEVQFSPITENIFATAAELAQPPSQDDGESIQYLLLGVGLSLIAVAMYYLRNIYVKPHKKEG